MFHAFAPDGVLPLLPHIDAAIYLRLDRHSVGLEVVVMVLLDDSGRRATGEHDEHHCDYEEDEGDKKAHEGVPAIGLQVVGAVLVLTIPQRVGIRGEVVEWIRTERVKVIFFVHGSRIYDLTIYDLQFMRPSVIRFMRPSVIRLFV